MPPSNKVPPDILWSYQKIRAIREDIQWTDEPQPAMAHNDQQMAMTREELEAHLRAHSAEMRATLADQSRATDARLAEFGAQINSAIEGMKEDRQAMREDSRSTRNAVIGSALAILLALFGAVYAINSMNSSIIGNVISAFESGRNSNAAAPPAPTASQPR